jgi:hypothetical protein
MSEIICIAIGGFYYIPGSLTAQPQQMYSFQPSQQFHYHSQANAYHTKEVDQHKKKMKEKPNTPKKANTGSTKLPTATQLY